MTQWQAIIHHHLKRDKVIPSSHPQYNKICPNPNGYEALMLLVVPYHPAFTDNGILIQPHPQQGKRSLDERHRRCLFCHLIQKCYLNTDHDWGKDIHIIRFLDSCESAAALRTMYNQEKQVPECHYKFTRERIAATIKEHINCPSFALMGCCTSAAVGSAAVGAGAVTGSCPTAGATRYCFSRSGTGGTGAGTGNGTQRSGNTGRSPHDRQVHAIAASSVPSLLDYDSSTEPSEDMIVAKLNGKCLGGCGKVHPPCECPNLAGDPAHQKKTFASLSSKRWFLPVRAITKAADDDDDADLIDLSDLDDEDSDTDQDFP